MFAPLLQLAGLAKRWPTFTAEEIERHHTRESLWIVAGGSVYDVTKLLREHPGGDGALLRRGGGTKDCTEDFLFHGRTARQDAEAHKIGVVDPSTKIDFEAVARRRAAATAAALAASHSASAPTVGADGGKHVAPAAFPRTSRSVAVAHHSSCCGAADHGQGLSPSFGPSLATRQHTLDNDIIVLNSPAAEDPARESEFPLYYVPGCCGAGKEHRVGSVHFHSREPSCSLTDGAASPVNDGPTAQARPPYPVVRLAPQ